MRVWLPATRAPLGSYVSGIRLTPSRACLPPTPGGLARGHAIERWEARSRRDEREIRRANASPRAPPTPEGSTLPRRRGGRRITHADESLHPRLPIGVCETCRGERL